MVHASRCGDARLAQAVACLFTEDPEPVALVRRQQDSRVVRTRLRRNVLCRLPRLSRKGPIGAARDQEPDRIHTVIASGPHQRGRSGANSEGDSIKVSG